MDLKTRLEQLQEALAAGYLNDAEFQELKLKLFNTQESADSDLNAMLAKAQQVQETEPADTGMENVTVYLEDEEIRPLKYMEMLTPGLEIGPSNHRFRLEKPLGDESKGRVWLATDLTLQGEGDNYKVLKIFAPRLQENPSLATLVKEGNSKAAQRIALLNLRPLLVRIRAKATLAALINHPNIIRVYGWRYGGDGWPFVEMEYLTGQTLQQWLNREGHPGLSWSHTLPVLLAIAAALDHAHQHYRLPHRSLNPGNVFITDKGVVKVMDFSLHYQPCFAPGKIQNQDFDSDLIRPLMLESRALQQLRYKPDVCALAVLAYTLLTGKAPYSEQKAGQEVYAAPAFAKSTLLPQELVKPPELTDNAWQVLLPCMYYQLETCPGSARELMQQLEAAQGPISSEHRNVKKWLALLIAANIVVVSFYLWMMEHSESPQNDAEQSPQGKEIGMQPAAPHVVSPEPVSNASGTKPAISANTAWHEADDRAFATAERSDTLSAYRTYLQRCPDCAHRESAEAAIKRLQLQVQTDALKSRFVAHLRARELASSNPKDKNALAVLRELEVLNPQDPFIAESRRQIALAYRDMAQESLKQHNYPEARNHLAKGEAVLAGLKELAELAREIDNAATRERDEAAYGQAQRANTRTAWQAYLAHCEPVCGHRREAQLALERLTSESPASSKQGFREPLADGSQGPEMLMIPAGAFAMGSPPTEKGRLDDEHLHEVRIKKAFAIGKYEVTFEEYDRFAEATGRQKPSDKGWGRSRRPVINVSWQDAVAYTEWLSAQTGHHYRLPTEAEWEYAARAGTATARYWGDNPDQGCDYANAADLKGRSVFPGWTVMNCDDGYVYTAPVGVYKPNIFGLHDMLGNVSEWTCSAYEEAYQGAEQVCADKDTVATVVMRGGSWSDSPSNVRAADRQKAAPGLQDYFLGFRVVRE
jgi:formylglycine-generating enzyme required for sulfatase activity/serine/threonine protein kinase